MKAACEKCHQIVNIKLITDAPIVGFVCEDCLNPMEDHWDSLRLATNLINSAGVEVTAAEVWGFMRSLMLEAVLEGDVPIWEACIPRQLLDVTTERDKYLALVEMLKISHAKQWERFGEMPDAGPEVGAWLAVLDGGTLE